MAAEGQCDTTASDMEVHMDQRYGIEFLHVDKSAPTNIPLHFVPVWQMAAEGQSDRMTTDMESWPLHMKKKCVAEFLHVGIIAPTDIQWHLLFLRKLWLHS